MNFAYKDISWMWKIGLAIIGVLVFIHILPFVVIAGIVIFAVVKCINYFKDKSKFRKNKGFSDKKIIDVKYHEVSK